MDYQDTISDVKNETKKRFDLKKRAQKCLFEPENRKIFFEEYHGEFFIDPKVR